MLKVVKVVLGSLALAGALILLKRRRKNRLPVDGKCVLITGCDSGIGLTLALHANSCGFHVIATCLNELSEGTNILKKRDIIVIQMDVTKPDDVENTKTAVERYLNENGLCLWAVINNAGVLIYGNFEWQVERQILQQVNVNLLGVFRVTKVFLPFLRVSKGRLINITSANGQLCLPGLSVYCASKHAIEGFTHCLRMELIPWNVKVILINPGNLPQSTRILSMQSRHASVMKESFHPLDWEVYSDYFDCFQDHLQKNFNLSPTGPFMDFGLQSALESSLTEESPKHFYNNIPLGFKIFIGVTRFLPVRLADSFLLNVWGRSIGWDWNGMRRYNTTA